MKESTTINNQDDGFLFKSMNVKGIKIKLIIKT